MDSFRLSVAFMATFYFLLCFNSIHAKNLTAVKCMGALPTGRLSFSLLYDQNDTIYVFGGYAGSKGSFDDAIKYSISQDTIQTVGQLPFLDHGGGAVMNRLGDIFYLSGLRGQGLYKFLPDLRAFVNVSDFFEGYSFFATVNPDPDTALLFGGFPIPYNAILSLNLSTLETTQIAQLREGTVSPAAIWVEEKDAAYVFDDETGTIQKYFRSSRRTEILPVRLPIQEFSGYGAVWDGRFGYLVGNNSPGNPAQSLAQFDPETETFAFIPVEDYEPINYSNAVYVNKLNRIYMLGGLQGGFYRNEIYYIDLSPLTQG